MSPLVRTAALAALLAAGLPAQAKEERAEIAAKLAEAKAAVERIRRQETDVGTEVERAEAELRAAEEASRLAQAELSAARRGLDEAQAGEARARAELDRRSQELAPRLRSRYRMMRQGGRGALLLSESPAAWLRLQRSFDTLLAADLAAIRDLRGVAEAHAAARRQIEAAEAQVARRATEAQATEAQARAATETRRQLLASIREERTLQEQSMRELAAAQRRLDGALAQLRTERAVPATGFGRLRGSLPWPAEGGVVEVAFGKVVNARFGTVTQQNGIDLRVHEGAEVKAVGGGQVAYAGWFRGYGNLVIVDHGDGFHTLYAHLAAIAQKVGDSVQAGELVGLVGDTGSLKGAYLYFEIRANGKPVDPLPWFRR